MPTILQFRRGTTAQNNNYAGASGELTVDTDLDSIRVHDGSTMGGFEVQARQALYADVAERYHADAIYEPGTLVKLGGENEITQTTADTETSILGIISTDPYCVMNSPHRRPDLTNEWHPPVALLGRVPTKVVGTINKGDLIVSSTTAGHGRAWTGPGPAPYGSVIGKAVENKTDSNAGIIEVVAGRP
jgi:hypothetical protein